MYEKQQEDLNEIRSLSGMNDMYVCLKGLGQ